MLSTLSLTRPADSAVPIGRYGTPCLRQCLHSCAARTAPHPRTPRDPTALPSALTAPWALWNLVHVVSIAPSAHTGAGAPDCPIGRGDASADRQFCVRLRRYRASDPDSRSSSPVTWNMRCASGPALMTISLSLADPHAHWSERAHRGHSRQNVRPAKSTTISLFA